jgi:hypothetical protein
MNLRVHQHRPPHPRTADKRRQALTWIKQPTTRSFLSFGASSTASSRRRTHIGRITSGYLPRLKRSRKTSSAILNSCLLLSNNYGMGPRIWFSRVSAKLHLTSNLRCITSIDTTRVEEDAIAPVCSNSAMRVPLTFNYPMTSTSSLLKKVFRGGP